MGAYTRGYEEVRVGAQRGAQRTTLAEAAELLGISKGAVRQRVRRGSLRSEKGEDGRVYVYVDPSVDDVHRRERDELVEALRDQVEDLRRERDEWREQARMTDRLLSAALERIPIEAPQEASEATETVEEEPETAEHRSPAEGAQEGAESRSGTGGAQPLSRVRLVPSDTLPVWQYVGGVALSGVWVGVGAVFIEAFALGVFLWRAPLW